MADFPILPLWTDAYIADTQHLTNEEHGVYLRLLMFAWRSKECGLPDDDRRLALMVGVTPKKWGVLKSVVMRFWILNEGLWTQKKLTSERENVERNRKQKRAAGIASSEAKALKRKDQAPTAVVEPLVTAHPTAEVQSISISKEEDKSSSNSRKTSLRDGSKSAAADAIETEFLETFWPIYPRKEDKKDALQAFRKARKKVDLETIMESLNRYSRKIEGKDRQYIRTPARFLNAEAWLDGSDEIPASMPVDVDRWRKRLQSGRRLHQWSAKEWGPAPGAPGCRVPAELLEPGDGIGWTELETAA